MHVFEVDFSSFNTLHMNFVSDIKSYTSAVKNHKNKYVAMSVCYLVNYIKRLM